MDEIRINSWQEFLKLADGFDVGRAFRIAYSYRGQSDADWDLKPGLLRFIEKNELSEEDALSLEKNATSEFQSQAHIHLPPNEYQNTKDTFSWWSVMQHHGVPTRLLDWTRSIFVAAYFATAENLERDGAIWLIHVNSIRQKMLELYGEADLPIKSADLERKLLVKDAKPVISFAIRKNKSIRMIAQQGHFSVCHNLMGDHGDIFSKVTIDNQPIFVFNKIIIPASLKLIFLKKLGSMNVTGSALFPGLDGIGKSVRDLIQISTQ